MTAGNERIIRQTAMALIQPPEQKGVVFLESIFPALHRAFCDRE
jgi:hypothetical protein